MPHSVHASSSPAPSDNELPDVPSSSASESTTSQTDSSIQRSSPASADAVPPQNQNLTDIFDDDEEDDEFGSSVPSSSLPQQPLPANHGEDYTNPGILRAFYQRLFPYRHVFQWLNHSPQPTNDFAHREFAFTLPGDVYARYQSFQTADLFRKALISAIPTRFEIGPVYSTNPRERKSLRPGAVFKPLQKEFVLDIDMSDYDTIRTCCTGASICDKCWAFITAARRILDVALREDFGWRHILWVYSGRRGVHAWVCDKSARNLDDRSRTAVANYLEALRGGQKKVAMRRPLHPHLERSLRIARETFQNDILRGQDPWRENDKAEHLLNLLPDAKLNAALRDQWQSNSNRSSKDKWDDIDELAADSSNHSQEFEAKKLLESKQDVVFEYTYPRLDSEVSKRLNHLLKSPFVVHPKTGQIAVPIPSSQWESFHPGDVPKVTQLLEEVDSWKDTDSNGDTNMATEKRKIPDYDKTSLKPFVHYFQSFVAELMRDEQPSGLKRKEGIDF
ncbi:MAG: hypothetical protein Q9162_001602 [Coniocarpon cinnabarinum]